MTRIWTLLLSMNCYVYSFPSDLTIYELGNKEHTFGGLRWGDSFNHPKPYDDSASVASLFQAHLKLGLDFTSIKLFE